MDKMDKAFETFPVLETRRLILRELNPADAEELFNIFSDNKLTEFYDLDTFTSLAQAEKLIERHSDRFANKSGLRWGIVRKESNSVIGTCGLNLHRHSVSGEIGYELARQYWRRGIMTEALRSVIDFGFEMQGLNRIQALVIIGNTASENLLLKLGFQEEGLLRDYGFFKGEFHDLTCFSILRKDWHVNSVHQR